MHAFRRSALPCRQVAGFTLVEMLVVMAILAILLYLLMPVFAKAREKVRQTACLSNQRQIAMGITMEVKDSSERFPTAEEVWTITKFDPHLLQCPSNPEDMPNSYAFNGLLAGTALGSVVSPTSTIMTGDAKSSAKATNNVITDPIDFDKRHNGWFVASFVDGHVKLIKEPPLPGEE